MAKIAPDTIAKMKPKSFLWEDDVGVYKALDGSISFKIRYYIRLPDGTPKRKTETVENATNKTQARGLLDKRRGEVFTGTYTEKVRSVTVGEFAPRFLELKRDLATVKRYKISLKLYVVPFFGNTPLTSITVAMCKEFRLKRLDEGASPATARFDLRTLQSLMSTAREDGHRCDDPVASVDLSVDNKRGRSLAATERKRLFEAAHARPENDYIRPMLYVLFYTGMRIGNACELRWEHVLFEHNQLILPRTKTKKYKPPMSKHLTAELKRWKRHCLSDQWVFPARNAREKPRTPDGCKARWKKLLADAKVRDFRRHDFRHNTVTTLRSKGAHDSRIMETTGHATLQMIDRYDHPEFGDVAAAVDLLPAPFEISERAGDPQVIPSEGNLEKQVETARQAYIKAIQELETHRNTGK